MLTLSALSLEATGVETLMGPKGVGNGADERYVPLSAMATRVAMRDRSAGRAFNLQKDMSTVQNGMCTDVSTNIATIVRLDNRKYQFIYEGTHEVCLCKACVPSIRGAS